MEHGLEASTWYALLALAFTLGLRHGLDADHLATIDGLARRSARSHPLASRFSGTLFSAGHGIVVLAVALAASLLTTGWETPGWLQVSGTLVSILFLLGLAFLNLHAVWTTPRHEMVAPVGVRSQLFARVIKVEHPLSMVAVGMLFAISFDTVSQAALFGFAASKFGGMWHALGAASAFVGGMMLADGLNGFWIARLIAKADRRALIASRLMATAVGFVSLAIGLFTLVKLISPVADAWNEQYGLYVGIGVIVAVTLAFALAMLAAPRAHSHAVEEPAE